VQATILPVSEAHADYAHEVAAELKGHGFRVELAAADETLGNRIRRAKGDKVPYVLVVGDDDVAHRTVGVNPRGNDVERDVPLVSFAERLAADVAAKK
jgi:threonyl-tRNA synthetase